MANTIPLDATMTINEIAARYPQTIPIFDRFALDTCCGGGLSVEDAARRDGTDPAAVMTALRNEVERR